MNEKKNTPAELIELLKLYSDTEMVYMINFAKQDVGAEQPSVTISYEKLLAEMEKRGIDCAHVKNYDGYLNEMVVELKVMKGKKRLFANWMLLMNDDDFSKSINDEDEYDEDYENENEEEDEQEYEFGIYCPICERVCECGHLVAIYDVSYDNFEGGDVYEYISQFEEIISEGFRHFMKKGKLNPAFTLRSLKECWDDFQSCDPKPDDEEINYDPNLTNQVILDLLRYHGADWSTNEVANSGPGFSSSEDFLFANDPIKVIKSAMARLKKEFPGLGK